MSKNGRAKMETSAPILKLITALLLFLVIYLSVFICAHNTSIYYLNLTISFRLFKMHRLGSGTSRSSDWEPSQAFYFRLTLSTQTGLRRPENQFMRFQAPPMNSEDSNATAIYRNELLDLGHCDTYEELCKFLKLKNAHFSSILARKMSTEFCRVADYDLFVVRLKTSSPTIWQKQPQGVYHLLCRVPFPFCESFATLQEWEWNQRTGGQSVQLDFLSRISMPPSTPFESAAYYNKLRSATIGGFTRSISKEILRYHLLDKLFTVEEALTILRDLDFFQQPVETWEQFLAQLEVTNPPPTTGQGAVVLPDFSINTSLQKGCDDTVTRVGVRLLD